MPVLDFLLGITDAQWDYLRREILKRYKAHPAGMPPWDSWAALRDKVGARRRASRHAHKRAKR